jgi:hypothetical protein
VAFLESIEEAKNGTVEKLAKCGRRHGQSFLSDPSNNSTPFLGLCSLNYLSPVLTDNETESGCYEREPRPCTAVQLD